VKKARRPKKSASRTGSSKTKKTTTKTKSKKPRVQVVRETIKRVALTPIPKMKVVRFAGVALGGGKTDKTSVAILDYFPDQKRVFLRSLREKVAGKHAPKPGDEITADEALLSVLNVEEDDLEIIAFDVPLSLPVSIGGTKKDEERVLAWMRKLHAQRSSDKRPNKMFTPYTERAAEIYIANALEEPFHPSHALGSNHAPLTARAQYLKKRLKQTLIETYPKLTLWRIGQALQIQKSYLRFHRHAVDSDEARLHILKTLVEKEIAFIYQQDLKTMVENNIPFEAFLCALTAFLHYRGQTEKRPRDFPKTEAWIDFPIQNMRWF
jgi:predicted nuclease with RNAse H fold